MHFFTSFVALLSLSASAFAVAVERDTAAVATKLNVCNPYASGSTLQQQQYDALAGFTQLFAVEENVKLAFDTYIPGQYIQHNPFSQQGRDFAISYLTSAFAPGTTKDTNITIWAGQGYGGMHYKMSSPDITFAVLDMFRFQGTCIVEHWDVLQQIFGNETNPIAFF